MPEQIPLMVDAVTQELRQFASDETIPRGQLLSALQVALTGLVTSDVSGVLASDTILQALGKLQAQASNKVDKVAGKSLSTEDYTSDEKAKLSDIASGATANATDTDLRDRTTHTGTQPITTITGVVGTMAGGSIIERGSNANGEYVKFADGTLMAFRSFTADVAASHTAAVGPYTIPVQFYGAPSTFVQGFATDALGSTTVAHLLPFYDNTWSAIAVGAGVTRVVGLRFFSVGRWK